MNIKKKIKRIVPRSIVWSREYQTRAKRANMTYAEVEQELDRRFKKVFGRKINWENPTTYNEKLNVAKLYDSTPLKSELTDKIKVVKWVKKQVGTELNFISLIATFNSIDEIDFSKLSEKYVIKMNNDSGSVFVQDGTKKITKDLIASYKYYYQKRNYAFNSYEMQYKTIQPKIMIEKNMGSSIRDYKFQCFDGKAVSCRVDFDRFGNHTRNFYNKNWELLPYNKGNYQNYPKSIKKPKNFEKMWKLAEKLSKDFDQVRVDFYDIDNKVYFGEMTFTNGSGFEKFNPEKIDLNMGKLWHLDMDAIRKRRQQLLSSNAKLGD